MQRSKQTGPIQTRDRKSALKPGTKKLRGKDGSGQGNVPLEVVNKKPLKKTKKK